MAMSEVQQRLPPVVSGAPVTTTVSSKPAPVANIMNTPQDLKPINSTTESTTASPLTDSAMGKSSPNYQTGQLPPHQLSTPPSKTTPQVKPEHDQINPGQPNAKSTTHVNNGTTTTKTNISSPICRNCKTQTTPLWRRDETGQVLCNACGLFLKLHGRPRPISLKTDTIKSRNRIKQSSQNQNNNLNSKASTSPNTPEFKSKDGKSSGRKSPKSKKSKNSTNTPNLDGNSPNPNLTPLLPATANSTSNTPGIFKTTSASNFPQPAISSYHHHHHHHHHLPNHLAHLQQGPTGQVPLHYPSSTPTQFAPGLQRITSPLLLSTSTSRGESDLGKLSQAAAGALETMAHHELGPNASFKASQGETSLVGVSLMNKFKREPGTPQVPPPPSSSVSSSSIFLSAINSRSTGNSTPQVQPPKLPALGSKISSPAFPPHSRSSTPIAHIQPLEASTGLPPIHKVAGGEPAMPPFSTFSNYNSENSQQQQQQQSQQAPHQNQPPNGFQSNEGNNNNNNNNNNGNTHEITLLKTRISELELVNDLYRTRIMELEAMEQAARLRENSMRKRFDEVLQNINLYTQVPPTQAPPPPPPQQVPSASSTVVATSNSTPSILPSMSVPDISNIPPIGITKLTTTDSQSLPPVLPSIRADPVILPSLKRENEDELDDNSKKTKLN
ncbi:Transcriptional regulator GZF3 [Spathaspora sp. JA1]|nr:Transcriptional regulator GZF3 [Spathaspora sp. JA1]